MNKVYCYCHFAGVYQCVRTRACVGVNGGWGWWCLCACVYVCVHGRYLEGLTVGGGRERERERVKFVSIVMLPVTKGLQVRDQC